MAHAEWMAVIQFSSSVWLQVYRGRDHERSKVTQHTNSFFFLFCFAPDVLKGQNFKDHKNKNTVNTGQCMQIKFVFIHRTVDIHAFSYLEQKSISQGIAEAEHKVLFGMFWYSLDNTVLHPDGMFGIAVGVNP